LILQAITKNPQQAIPVQKRTFPKAR